MELKELDLIAYGPFSERKLVFGKGPGGFHLIYGANEAGKSSSLRALKALLFGIPNRTEDNFLHSHGELRIGGCLRDDDGRELCFIRRKGYKNTLLTPEGEPLEESRLIPFLRGITAELFGSLFAIDHRELVRGGEAILAQEGEVGQALFAASLGTPAVHRVLQRLEKEADALFRPRGSTQAINAALAEYRRLRQALQESSLSSRTWKAHRQTYEAACADLERLQKRLGEKRAAVARLERIRRTVPKLVRRRELLQRLAQFSDVAILSADFGKRRREAVSRLDEARLLERQAQAKLSEVQRRLAALNVDEELLQQAELIDALYQRLASFRAAQQKQPRLKATYEQLLLDASSLLQTVRPDLSLEKSEVLRPILKQQRRIGILGRELQRLQEERSRIEELRHRLSSRLEKVHASLARFSDQPVQDLLRQALQEARSGGNLDERVRDLETEIATLERQCQQARKRLGLTGQTEGWLLATPVPSRETVDRYGEEMEDLKRCVEQIGEQETQCADSLRRIKRELEEIKSHGTLPSERQLKEARRQREVLWRLIRRHWLAGEDIQEALRHLEGEGGLPERYERQVAEADTIADRLRHDAERVQRLVALRVQRKELEQQLETFHRKRAEVEQSRDALWEQWCALWAPWGIDVLMPKEMRAWLQKLEELLRELQQLATLRGQLKHILEVRDGHIVRLMALLGKEVPVGRGGGLPLKAVLECAEQQIREEERLRQERDRCIEERERLNQELEEAEARLAVVTARLNELREKWKAAVGATGLSADSLPEEALEMVERVRDLFGKLEQVEKTRLQLRQIEEEITDFSDQVDAVVRQLRREPIDSTPEQVVLQLARSVKETQSNAALYAQYEKQREMLQQELNEARGVVESMSIRLQSLAVEAGCDQNQGDGASLEAAELRFMEYQRLEEEQERLERELTEAEGMALELLEQEAEKEEIDSLSIQIHELQGQIEELEKEQTLLIEKKVQEEKILEQMDGRDHAAQLAEQMQGLLARIRTDAEHYLCLTLAFYLLQEQIECHRRKNQGPLLKRASELFAALTRGSFKSLRTEFFAGKEEPELVGVRPDDALVRVTGMSSGTRDQLYLALRLASLERYIAKSGAMPFIVDDILVHFDDPRTRATLSLLVELARRTQVILFTHHRHVVELARDLDDASVVIHQL